PEDHAATLQAVANGELTLSDFVSQLTDFELACLLDGGAGVGKVIGCPDDPTVPLTVEKSKPSAPNSYSTGAGASRANSRVGIPSLSYCDGSGGIILGTGIADKLKTEPNPGYPKATGVATSWNPALYSEWGKSVAGEMHAANIDVWLAPSINLHRNPLNGRNPEYYSEDPILSGTVAKNVLTSVGEAGLTVCVKHFVGNDQEQFRRGRHTRHSEAEGNSLDAINTITSERTLREINLKPFEMAIRTGLVYCVMSAFNKINGHYCSACPDLLTDILRGEWGFRGFVVTDWGDYDEIANGASEMIAGNDVIMSGVHTRYSISDEVFSGIAEGRLTRARLLENAEHLLTTILHSTNIFADGKYNTGLIGASDVPYHETTTLQVKTGMLPPAIIGCPYEELKQTPLFAGGDEGTTRYTWSISPDSAVSAEAFAAFGLELHGSGKITGCAKPGTAGDYDVTFRVTSDFGTADKTLSFSIREITVLPEILPEVRLGIPYAETVQAFCGEDKVSLTIEGTLPKGLSFDAETGLISGMPEEAGLYEVCNFTVHAQGETVQGSRSYQLRTENYIDIAFRPAGGITVEAGSPIRVPFTATRGIHAATYEFSLVDAPESIHIAGMRFIGYWLDGVLNTPGVYPFKLH
ncbi:MAG: putative Ig domain-containing protein, partial [Clostridia bacterium]|nr:putative Ig domain-containing protein [Clostridia bacterium]